MATRRFLAFFVVLLAVPSSALAGGYDTPMLYSARHMGMGGTAVAYVNDPSAMFHNPAGLAGTERFSLIGDFSLLVGDLESSPNQDARDITSETTIAPFFLIGASVRATDWLTFGAAVYPVASAGATYEYDLGGLPYEDETRLVFFEASPGVAFEVPDYNLSFGLGWRITFVTLDRTRKAIGEEPFGDDVDFSASGASFAGLRFGTQWQPIPELQVGVAYRHKTETDVEDTSDPYALFPAERVDTTFTLPSRLSAGVRGNLGPASATFDFEYAFNSQNDWTLITAEGDGMTVPVQNVFDWSNAVTLRAGLEYRLLEERLPLRVGYVWDQKTASSIYPTAFGTPPAATHVVTVGTGYDFGPISVNVAYAHRRGGTRYTDDQFNRRDENPLGLMNSGQGGTCEFCGFPNEEPGAEYFIRLNGIYVDISYSLGASTPDAEPEEEPTPAVDDEPTYEEPGTGLPPEPADESVDESGTLGTDYGGDDAYGGNAESALGGDDQAIEEEPVPFTE